MMVYFYLPYSHITSDLPAPDDFEWNDYSLGKFCWVVQTFHRLKAAGVDCELVHELPKDGVVISHRACFPDFLIPKFGQIFICISADWGRHPFSQFFICQNKKQLHSSGIPRLERYFWPGKSYFVHLWPQPGLIPRNVDRIEQEVVNIGYFGLAENLTTELRSDDWKSFLTTHGMNWCVISSPEKWRDYRSIDAVIFIRDFSGKKHINKPATKLYNAWIAGVIPICSPESAYVDEITSPNDAIVVDNYSDLKNKLLQLKNDMSLVKEIKKHGRHKSQEYTIPIIAQEWISIFDQIKSYKMGRIQYLSFLFLRCISLMLVKILRKKVV